VSFYLEPLRGVINLNDSTKVYPPSKFIKDELERRKWTQADLAFVVGRHSNDISALVSGKRRITPEIARALSSALGNPPEYWLALESAYRLSQLESVDEDVARRSRLFNAFPVKEIVKRGWITPTNDLNELESQLFNFFEINSFEEEPKMRYAARKSTPYVGTTITQAAWLKRAEQIAPVVMVKKFSDIKLAEAIKKLQLLLNDVEEIRHVPKILAEAGVRVVIIEPLVNTQIDGVTFWLDSHSPVIVLSLRYDRIDAFWHTLFHELSHVKHGEGLDSPIVDSDLIDDMSATEKPPFEQRAERDAARFSIPDSKLDSFILRAHPSYTEQKILGFAALNNVHPGILVGQLHHKYRSTGKGLPFSHQRKFLVKVRHVITDSTLTDGWGHQVLISA
jgi:HTH-type transcriptional regulator/antitoxin HigA